MRNRILCLVLLLPLAAGSVAVRPARAGAVVNDIGYLEDRKALDELQRSAFRFAWECAEPHSGMVYEAAPGWDNPPVTVGGTGFAVAAIVVAADREWIARDQAVRRVMRIARFLLDESPRGELHGAFPHWLDGATGKAVRFGDKDTGADLVETSFLLQGLLIARAYFNGPGMERELRAVITRLWEDIDWNWFTNGEEDGLYWHWDKDHGFYHGLKILGYNECLITYVLAASSPTHPISRAAYDYWTRGPDYGARDLFGYRVEATPESGGPLFLSHYSFIGLDPRMLADGFVRSYFVRGVKQTLSNRAYCLQEAPRENGYAEDFWGLTASRTPDGYAANSPLLDNATVAPTAALSSIPYTPEHSLRVLRRLRGELRKRAWGHYGPYDAISLRRDWFSGDYLAIDQLPIVCMVENYRTNLLWRLFMSIPEIHAGLARAGLAKPDFATGFPEAVPTLRKDDGPGYRPDAYDICRHPDTGLYSIPYWCAEAAPKASFSFTDSDGKIQFESEAPARTGRNSLTFPLFMPLDGEILTLSLRIGEREWTLPVRLH